MRGRVVKAGPDEGDTLAGIADREVWRGSVLKGEVCLSTTKVGEGMVVTDWGRSSVTQDT